MIRGVASSKDPGTRRRLGAVIELESIARFVQLIPNFEKKANVMLSADNSMNKAKSFWVNSFADKEIFQAVY